LYDSSFVFVEFHLEIRGCAAGFWLVCKSLQHLIDFYGESCERRFDTRLASHCLRSAAVLDQKLIPLENEQVKVVHVTKTKNKLSYYDFLLQLIS